MEADRTAFVRTMGFSNPIMTTRNGRPSESRTRLIGTPIFIVTVSPKRNAKTEEVRTVAASQKLDPSLRMERKSDTNVRCIERYPKTMIMMSRVSAFLMRSRKAVHASRNQLCTLPALFALFLTAFMIHLRSSSESSPGMRRPSKSWSAAAISCTDSRNPAAASKGTEYARVVS